MRKEQGYRFNHMTMGTCYYPEHWDESLWESDLERMLEVGISVIRIAEFAWSKFEPKEGKFDFSFFDRFLKLCSKKKMKVVMCTPTATPPAWLTEKYPEVLNKTIDGVTLRHGARKHHTNSSEKYNELVARLVTKMAKHYANTDCIIGWQIDNEINCEVCEYYAEADDKAFRTFLKKKYGKVSKLNEAWGTAFWNQDYTDWDEVHVPQPILNRGKNPSRYLDYYRYVSESARGYLGLQSQILRKYIKKGVFISTNGIFWNLDNHQMTDESLDIYFYDSYPNFPNTLDWDPNDKSVFKDRQWSRKLIETRSICPHFGIMEQQSGAGAWVSRMLGPSPKPGQINLWALQSVAHGADFISFFRWRTCAMGTEMYWHGILDYDNRDNRKLAEVGYFNKNFKRLEPVCGADVVSGVAVIRDYDNLWDTNTDEWHKLVHDPSERDLFETLELTHTGYDYLYINDETGIDELAKYKLLFYPHPVIMTSERAAVLKKYVEQGGTLIVGCRAGYKDITGKCPMMAQPGLLSEITGSDVYDWTIVNEKDNEQPVIKMADVELVAPVFNDIMRVRDEDEASDAVKILGTYANKYYADSAAIIEKTTKKGRSIHVGTVFTPQIIRTLLDYTGVLTPHKDVIEAPEDVEIVVREKKISKNKSIRYYFVINYNEEARTILLKKEMKNLLEDSLEEPGKAKLTKLEGECTLKPYEVAVYY